MNTTITDRTLALAGLFQSARLVQELAREGRTDTSAFITSIQALTMIDAPAPTRCTAGRGA
jgi:high frequency lysogenization protein